MPTRLVEPKPAGPYVSAKVQEISSKRMINAKTFWSEMKAALKRQ